MNIGRPAPTEHSPYFSRYIELAPEEDIIGALEKQRDTTRKLLESIDETRAAYRYAPGKWSIKELVGHITDSERVFAYRALCIARGEKQSLPGFEQDDYIAASGFDAVPLRDLVRGQTTVRDATLSLLKTLPPAAWATRGLANNAEITARALAFIILGHERHHLKVLKEKYGV